MSGPKDFVIVFAAARLVQIVATRRAEQRKRKAAAKARLAQQKQVAERRVAEMAALRAAIEVEARKRAAVAKTNLAERRQAVAGRTAERVSRNQSASNHNRRNARKQEIDSARQEDDHGGEAQENLSPESESELSGNSTISSSVGNAYSAIDGLMGLSDSLAHDAAGKLSNEIERLEESQETHANILQRLERIQSAAKVEYEAALGRAHRLPELIQQILCWQGELTQDDAASHFFRERVSEWQVQANSMLKDHSTGQSTDLLIEQSQKLLDQAEQICQQAGETQAAFATRNELLADIVASLQEIGFFVSDPHFENPNDPAGSVSVKATRGGEEVSASIDLKDVVRSTWNGISEEHCKDSFFQYVDQMKAKGIEVKPSRADLQDRPQLKQKGAKSLPNSQQQSRGK